MDDRDLLTALCNAIQVISDARCSIDGEAALITVVNSDLTRILRRLNSRAASNTHAAPLQQQQQRLGQQQHHSGLTQSAAAGFMAGLQRAYGTAAATHATTSAEQQQQQQQEPLSNGARAAVKQLPLLKFAQHAEFTRLVSTALSAVQVANQAGPDSGSRGCTQDDLMPSSA
ncbi:hypothetical protein OEZ85_008166 [Tetradesmus obliquus]|uniref:Uncharacterized protein n=1 Tax=Tetradesmus obliquus TaxID=3088 RepID=A0ABY8TI35_TETOB|nr:hypothetical protein OEZ85_008166 [Tetradesmus obliquus]